MPRIIKRGNSYLIRVSCGRDYTGKQIVYNTSFTPTKTTPKAIEKEVRSFADEYERKVKSGEILPGERITFNEMTEKWKTDWAIDHLTLSQYEQYISVLEMHILPRIGHMSISKVTPLLLQTFVQEWKKKYAPQTIRRFVTSMNSVFKYAYRLNVIKENPVSRLELPPLKKDTGIHCFTLEQSKRFLEFLSEPFRVKHRGHKRNGEYEVSEYYETHTVPYQFQVYFNLSIIGGFRRGELLALQWKDIDFINDTISVSKAVSDTKTSGMIIKTPKTKSGIRCLKMPPQSMDMLKAWRFQQYEMSLSDSWEGETGENFSQNYVFIQKNGKIMDTKTPSQKFKKLIKRYNESCINEADKLPLIRLHDLRHTSATLLISEGCDISTVSHRLGHSKTSMTLDVYTHHLEAKDEEASETLGSLFSSDRTSGNASQTVSDSELLSVLNNLTPDQMERLKLSLLGQDFVSRMCHEQEKCDTEERQKSLIYRENEQSDPLTWKGSWVRVPYSSYKK